MTNIVAMGYYTGELYITTDEKAKTVAKTDKEAERIAETYKKGLGVLGTTVARPGEDPVTAAANAIVYHSLANNTNLSGIRNLFFATESGNDLSKNAGNAIIEAVNRMSGILDGAGIHIGTLEDAEISLHAQSACIGGVAALASAAKNGVEGSSLIVAFDEGKYGFGTRPDLTGGFGAVVIELGEKIPAGISVKKSVGHSRANVDDFSKPVLSPSDEITGISLTSKYPMVFGEYSEYIYLLHTFKALGRLFEKIGEDVNDPAVLSKYVFIGHVPFPAMVQKQAANLMAHYMRVNEEFRSKMLTEMGLPEMPNLNGFKSQSEAFEFMQDVGGIVVKLAKVQRLAEMDQRGTADVKLLAKKARVKLEAAKRKFRIKEGSQLAELFKETSKNAADLGKNATVKDLIAVFSAIYDINPETNRGFINRHIIAPDKEFSRAIRKSETYRNLERSMRLPESLALARDTGNIYTGSAPLALASYLLNTPPDEIREREIIFFGFGSGAETYALLLSPHDYVEGLQEGLHLLRSLSEAHRRTIKKGEYSSIRNGTGAESDAVLTIDRLGYDFSANEGKLIARALEIKELVAMRDQTLVLKQVSRTPQTAKAKVRL